MRTAAPRRTRAPSTEPFLRSRFLGNLLTALVGLNRAGERERLEEALLALSRLFYYAEDPETLVALDRECGFVESYLELQKLRFEDRLSFSVSIEEAVRDAAVPRSLLLGLVESSVVCGIEPMATPGWVAVSCRAEGVNGVAITVEDNGLSFDATDSGPRAGRVRAAGRCLLASLPTSSIRAERGGTRVRLLLRARRP